MAALAPSRIVEKRLEPALSMPIRLARPSGVTVTFAPCNTPHDASCTCRIHSGAGVWASASSLLRVASASAAPTSRMAAASASALRITACASDSARILTASAEIRAASSSLRARLSLAAFSASICACATAASPLASATAAAALPSASRMDARAWEPKRALDTWASTFCMASCSSWCTTASSLMFQSDMARSMRVTPTRSSCASSERRLWSKATCACSAKPPPPPSSKRAPRSPSSSSSPPAPPATVASLSVRPFRWLPLAPMSRMCVWLQLARIAEWHACVRKCSSPPSPWYCAAFCGLEISNVTVNATFSGMRCESTVEIVSGAVVRMPT
mmetsp:Transcript_66050/g.159655  ORF Transcript_66050/g.159655 Transcript_66050/m.159655 type:complete len:331 (-) Transcript_66050:305-1297(-)